MVTKSPLRTPSHLTSSAYLLDSSTDEEVRPPARYVLSIKTPLGFQSTRPRNGTCGCVVCSRFRNARVARSGNPFAVTTTQGRRVCTRSSEKSLLNTACFSTIKT